MKEFHKNRKPFYIDDESLLIKFPTAKHMDSPHSIWFTETGVPFVHCVRGYYLKTKSDEYVMIYWNDFEVPNVNASLFAYLFDYFPNINYIGLGCIKTNKDEVWKPKLKVIRNG